MERLQLTTLVAQNISSALLVATYTATGDKELLIQLYLSGLAGAGTYKAYLTKQLIGAGSVYQSGTTDIALAAGVMTAWLSTTPLPAKNTDIIKVYAQGLVTDTSVGVQVEVFDVTASALTSQNVVDALKLAPTAGDPAAGSVNKQLDDIQAKTDNLPASPAAVGSAMTLATGAITAAVIATGAVDADALATDAAAEIADAIWDEATSGHTTEGTFGEQAKTDIDAILADTGTDGVVVANLTTAAKALVQTEAEDALKAYDLDHLIETTAGSEKPTDGTYLDQIMNKDVNQAFDATTDSLEAIRDTLASSGITVVSAVDGGTITIRTHNTLVASLTVGSLTGYKKLWLTVKNAKTDTDTSALIQVAKYATGTDGLLYLNGAAPATPILSTDSSIAIVTEATGAITWTLKAAAAALLLGDRKDLYGEVKWMDATDQLLTKTTYTVNIDWGIGKVTS